MPGGPRQVAEHRRGRNADDLGQRVQLAPLFGRALRGRLVQAQAVVDAAAQVSLRHAPAGRQALPQRVGGFTRARMVAAQRLVHHPQVEPELVGLAAAGQHAAGQQHRVVRAPAGGVTGVGFGGLGGHAGAPRLAVQQRAARRTHLLHEELAQPLGVFGGGAHRHAALAEAGAGPGIAGARHDGPALQVFHRAGQRGRAQRRAAMRMQHQVALAGLPAGRQRDQVEGAGRVAAAEAAGARRLLQHVGRAGHRRGGGLGREHRHVGRAGGSCGVGLPAQLGAAGQQHRQCSGGQGHAAAAHHRVPPSAGARRRRTQAPSAARPPSISA